ncbi:hypothetical protein HDU85_005234 [Gaertneriomyces sp. JEL0708]|nr:hypothetical protein HDU85_005234 [Gaertneriomyces sp. JEL0708]
MSTVPLLHRLDPIEYFAPIMPAIKSNSSTASRSSDPNVNHRTPPNSRKKYQMAYLLTLHDPGTFTQSIELIRSLNDTSALFLIQISLQSTLLHEKFTTYLFQHPSPNVHLSQTRYNAFWGHVSIVHMQLSGFFELLDLGEWKYVINLSGHDWPLRSSQQIYESLEREGYKWKGWEHIQEMGDIIALNSPFSDRIAPTNKRFVRFRGAHPDWLHMSDTIHFPVDSPHADPQYFVIRKVDILKETELREWILHEHVKKHENVTKNENTADTAEEA